MFNAQSAGSGYFIRHVKTGLCLDVDGFNGSGGSGARLTLYPCSAADDHVWTSR